MATQLCFHLINVYDHLLKVGFENGELLDQGFSHLLLIFDKEENFLDIRLNLSEQGIEDVIIVLMRNLCTRMRMNYKGDVAQ